MPTGGYTLTQFVPESALALSDDDGDTWKMRRLVDESRLEEFDGVPVLISTSRFFRDVTVETYLIPPAAGTPNWHLRVHHIKAGRDLQLAEGAFAVYGCRESDGRILTSQDTGSSEGVWADEDGAFVASRSGAVGITQLLPGAWQSEVVLADANSNLVESRTLLPAVLSDIKAGESRWFASAVFAIPSSVEGWAETWQQAKANRPSIPAWLTRAKMRQ